MKSCFTQPLDLRIQATRTRIAKKDEESRLVPCVSALRKQWQQAYRDILQRDTNTMG